MAAWRAAAAAGWRRARTFLRRLVEAALRGVPIHQAGDMPQPAHLDHLSPIDDIRATGAYRRDAALTLLRDLLRELAA